MQGSVSESDSNKFDDNSDSNLDSFEEICLKIRGARKFCFYKHEIIFTCTKSSNDGENDLSISFHRTELDTTVREHH
jgi:hypothetical protein